MGDWDWDCDGDGDGYGYGGLSKGEVVDRWIGVGRGRVSITPRTEGRVVVPEEIGIWEVGGAWYHLLDMCEGAI